MMDAFVRRVISGAALVFTPVALVSNTVVAKGGGGPGSSSKSTLMKMKRDLRSSSGKKEDGVVLEKSKGDAVNMVSDLLNGLSKDELSELFSSMSEFFNGSGVLKDRELLAASNDKVTLSVTSVSKDQNDLVKAYKLSREAAVCTLDFLDPSAYSGGKEDIDKFLQEYVFGFQPKFGSVKFITVRDTVSGEVVGQFTLSEPNSFTFPDGVKGDDKGTVILNGWAVSAGYFEDGFRLLLSKLSVNGLVKKIVVVPVLENGAVLNATLGELGKGGMAGFSKFNVKETCYYKKLLRSRDTGDAILKSGTLLSLNNEPILDVDGERIETPVPEEKVAEVAKAFEEERKGVPRSRVPVSGFVERTRAHSNQMSRDLIKDDKYDLIDSVDGVFVEYSFER